MKFQKGKVANPEGGRIWRPFYDAVHRACVQDDGKRLRKAAEQLLTKASQGEPWAIQMLADRLDGKADQTVRFLRQAVNLDDATLAKVVAEGGGSGVAGAEDGAGEPGVVH